MLFAIEDYVKRIAGMNRSEFVDVPLESPADVLRRRYKTGYG